MKKIVSVILALIMLTAITACASTQKLNFGKEYSPAKSQLDVLIQLNAKTVDVGILDSIMAGYYMSQDSTYASSLTEIEGLALTTEQYGIAARKGSALIYYINKALAEVEAEGTVKALGEKYGIASELCELNTAEQTEPEDTSDWDYIQTNGKLIIGYTLFAPIAFEDGGELKGFDIELARAVCEKLGLTPEFVVINWSTKEASLEGKTIDCIWNGLTINEERLVTMEISIPYLNNKQIAVIRKEDADKYKSTADMADAIIGAEDGSAGEICIVAGE